MTTMGYKRCGQDTRLSPHKIDAAGMRRLMLLRHAKSDWSSPGCPTASAAHARAGAGDARTMGVYLARHASSPTASCVRRPNGPGKPPRRSSRDGRRPWRSPIPIGSRGIARSHPRSSVRSRPRFMGPGDRPQSRPPGGRPHAHRRWRHRAARTAAREVSTAALAVIDFPIDAWSKLHRQSGRLDRFVTPRWIAAVAN